MLGSSAWSVRWPAVRARLAASEADNLRTQHALHDGVQQDLIAIAVRLQLARRLVASDRPAALALLEEMGRDVREALHRVRALAEEIYPVVLDTCGLPDALRAAAVAAGVSATVEAVDIGRHAPEVEMAVYWCGRASLENVAAHAGTRACATVRLREGAGAIDIEVTDDGTGFDLAEHPPTGGLAAAHDRVEALNGSMTVHSETGHGTCVQATVPFYDAPSQR